MRKRTTNVLGLRIHVGFVCYCMGLTSGSSNCEMRRSVLLDGIRSDRSSPTVVGNWAEPCDDDVGVRRIAELWWYGTRRTTSARWGERWKRVVRHAELTTGHFSGPDPLCTRNCRPNPTRRMDPTRGQLWIGAGKSRLLGLGFFWKPEIWKSPKFRAFLIFTILFVDQKPAS